jgi:murein DD-endopeptidase MepM/ murein hydrolase activator NlpD
MYLLFFLISSAMAVHDNSVYYCLPYMQNNTHVLTEGENGKTHKNEHQFAFDFEMSIGTPVHAARAGEVVSVVDKFRDRGQNAGFIRQGNSVILKHSDGSYAIYAHLDKAGAAVKVGDKIKTGQLIAYSGNTGFTKAPHLHFEVFTLENKKHTSVPIAFITKDSPAAKLEAMKSYTSVSSCNN